MFDPFEMDETTTPTSNDIDNHRLDPLLNKEKEKEEEIEEEVVDMQLYCLHPALEGQLRGLEDPMEWPQALTDFVVESSSSQSNNNKNDDDDDDGDGRGGMETTTTVAVVNLLPKCDVQWSRRLDPVQHQYAQERNNDRLQQQTKQQQQQQPESNHTGKRNKNNTGTTLDLGIHAIMVYGEALVDSTMIPGQQILIRDQLSIWGNDGNNDDDSGDSSSSSSASSSSSSFWIHDRGYDPETMDFIYGNQRGIPYQLDRVTNIVVCDKDDSTSSNSHGTTRQREVVRKDLQWTLGPHWRTEEEYQTKLEVLGGGVSSQLNKKS